MRVAFAVSTAIAICAVAPAYADAASHVQAARRAERKGQWKKALAEWKAAYAADVNAEYLVGIGDAYSHLGKKDEAKKNYDAYLADPLALPATSDKVRLKIARLGGGAATELALPGPGLDLPGSSTPPPVVADNRKGKKKKPADGTLALPGMDLPGATAQQAPDPNALTLPGMDLPPPSKPKTVATAQPGLDLPPPAAKPPPVAPPPKIIASTTPARPPPDAIATTRVPDAAMGQGPRPQADSGGSGSTRKVVAYVALGVAVVALAGGGIVYAKGSSAGSDLTGSKHTGAEAHDLLNTEKNDKTLGLVGLAAGLVAGGTAIALFAF
jgi:hypothetical protein